MAKLKELQVGGLTDLVPLVRKTNGFDNVLAEMRAGSSGTIDGAWGSSCALTAAAIAEECPSTLLVVLPQFTEVDDFALDLQHFCGQAPMVFPAWETLPEEHSMNDSVFGGRLRCVAEVESQQPPKLIVACFPSLMQPVPDRASRDEATREFDLGTEVDLDETIEWLIARGFARVSAIEMAGEFCLHGGILDIFPTDALNPVRIELFGDEIESIRSFDVESQRKLFDLNSVRVTAVAPVDFASSVDLKDGDGSHSAHFIDSLPEDTWIVLAELNDLVDSGKHYLERIGDSKGLYSPQSVLAKCTQHPTVTISAIGTASTETTCHLRTESIERFTGPKSTVIDEMASTIGPEESVLLCCHNEGEQERLEELFREKQPGLLERLSFCVGHLTHGFRLVEDQVVAISDHELFGRTEIHRTGRLAKVERRAIDSFLELAQGDLVVHLSHGVGRYCGMQLVEKEGSAEEHLVIEFADAVKVFVPASLIHLVQKYVGATKALPRLSKLGTTSWSKKKQKVAKAVADMAAEMIQLQAQRASRPGIAFPPDSHWCQEFEAAFPYDETPDQLTAIASIRGDMQLPRPMDRLVCGDVGYGKTEVAMRAAFRAIDAGKQVVVLVPTTVLSEQHYRTFSERMAEYPFEIDMISRFRTKKEQKQILERLADGSLDLVIGTHRLVQKDVRVKDLGLLVIDEEQRFGVDAKEMLKRLRLEIDVLTLSATPIPRTLHMSLLGIRDISNLETPPRDRQAIETRICRFDETLIRQGIVRELNRNGQVYFVHNRVHNIRTIADRLQAIVPEASIGIVHGQMSESELETSMSGFVRGEIDILVATTIIESGLDIPNANTMFIHEADRYGLADMHQLRGRVGRYKHRAYCYLLLEEGKSLTGTAAKRLKAIEEFSELGAGFKISMRDLEIRGAGNILGNEQSGHISLVGYELYCQLLENAVRSMKNEPLREHPHVNVDLPLSAFLPGTYVPPGRHKIEMYRRFSAVGTMNELEELRNELRDRFGPIPKEAETMLDLKELQIHARHWQIDGIRLEDGFGVFSYRNKLLIKELRDTASGDVRIMDGRDACLVLQPDATVLEILEQMKTVLRPA